MIALSILFGILIGLSLGLTGGGGAIFAVPLLVYGLATPPKDAVAISLAAVGATSFVGFLHRWKLGEVEIRTGLLFAIAGMIGAPIGTWLASLLPDALLLLSFAVLMVIVAVRLWRQASKAKSSKAAKAALEQSACDPAASEDGPACRRDASGVLLLTSRCAMLLVVVGLLTGVLSGLFGVGGGFVIVPALVLASGMSMHRAVGTSLLAISLVSAAGITSQLLGGREIPLDVAALFVGGGIAGLFAGQQIAKRLSGPVLQRVFAVAILAVAAFVILKNFNS